MGFLILLKKIRDFKMGLGITVPTVNTVNMTCWLSPARTGKPSPPLSSQQPPAGPASQSVFAVEGLLSVSTAPLPKIPDHQRAPGGSG